MTGNAKAPLPPLKEKEKKKKERKNRTVVHDDLVMHPLRLGVFQLQLGLLQPFLHAALVLGPAAAEAQLKYVFRGRGDEDKAGGDVALLDLFYALFRSVVRSSGHGAKRGGAE